MNKVVQTKALYRGLGWPTIFTQIRFFTAPYQRLEKLIPKKGFILDLGCGYGILSNFLGLTGRKRKILGIDYDRGKIKLAERGVKNVRFRFGDVTKVNLPQAETILMVHLLHHLNSFAAQKKLLLKCKKSLKRGGRMIVTEIDKKPFFKFLLTRLADFLLYPGDKVYYRFRKEALQLFKALGFQVKTISAHQGKPFSHLIYVLKVDKLEKQY